MSKIDVNLAHCAGHGKCYLLAPDLFEPFDDDGRAEWVGGELAPEDEERAARAVANCPEHALTRIETQPGRASQ